VHKAAHLGFDASVVYSPEGHPEPTAPAYRDYAAPVARRCDDAPDVVVVAPETQVPDLFSFRYAQRALWWLSVDNFLVRNEAARRQLDVVYHPDSRLLHLAQSQYAVDHLSGRGIIAVPLTDYVPADAVADLRSRRRAPKDDIIVYNPQKGFEVTRQLMARAPHLQWVPIEGLSRSGVIDLLGRAKAYIDFGGHPGRDRLPREAALAGACVLVGRRGSAVNPVDVPVPTPYKFSAGGEDHARIITALEGVLSDHASHARRFEGYQQWVGSQESTFTDETFMFCAALQARMQAGARFHV
jgi:hypothetical protein